MDNTTMLPKWSRLAIGIAPWVAVWAVAALVLAHVWPVGPRLNISLDEDAKVLGITPNSSELVTTTAVRCADWGFMDSGPLQVIDLQTGTRRSIHLPREPVCSSRVTGLNGLTYWKLPESWQIKAGTDSFHGRWMLCRWSKMPESRTQITPNLVVNLDTGESLEAAAQTEFDLSHTGRYLLENHSPTPKSRRLRVLETATAMEQLAFDVAGTDNGWTFSPNERHFAYAAIAETEQDPENRLWVWQIAPAKLLHLFEGYYSSVVFSPDGTRLAFVELKNSDKTIVVIDVETGDRILEHSAGRGFRHHFTADGPRLAFSQDSKWVVSFRDQPDDYLESRHSPLMIELDLADGWNLTTGEQITFGERILASYHSSTVNSRAILPFIGYENHLVISLPEGKVVGHLSQEGWLFDITNDGKTLLVEDSNSQTIDWGSVLSRWGLPLPNLISGVFRSESDIQLIDITTNQIQGHIPTPGDIVALTHDDRTLITQKDRTEPVYQVWDFPPRASHVEPLLWALLAPLMVYGLRWWRLRRAVNHAGRGTNAAVPASGVNP